ncbi:MAG: hypothetical protein WBK37_09600 [Kiritimatiellia bacterium]|nr:hypothetical protein [Kiritimatiellia bacterium]HQM23592.1 hypothetical protein [Kiritimatiellia bacterium]
MEKVWRNFPHNGTTLKKFSTQWKTFAEKVPRCGKMLVGGDRIFHGVETFFPQCGKMGGFFPRNGKIPRTRDKLSAIFPHNGTTLRKKFHGVEKGVGGGMDFMGSLVARRCGR